MGIFNDIANWFEDLGKDKVSKEDENELIGKLADMNVKENIRLDNIAKEIAAANRPEDKEFEYLEDYVPVDEETLKKQSTDKYSDDYNKSLESANSDYEDKLFKEQNKEEGYKNSAAQKSDYYNDKYKEIQEYYKSKASKNGIADSSIKSEKSIALQDERDGYIEDVLKALKNKLELSEKNKQELLENKDKKVTAIDDKFKKDVEEYFNKLMADEDKKVKEVQDKNKKTAEQEKAYKEYQTKAVQDKFNEIKKQQQKAIEKELLGEGYLDEHREKEYQNRYNLALDFYKQFKRESAIDSIERNKNLQTFLGTKYYTLLEAIRNG